MAPRWAQLGSSRLVRAKLTVGGQDDPAEREADRVADEVAGPGADEVAGPGADQNQIGPADGSAAATGPPPPEQDDNLVRRAVSAGRPMSAGWQQLVSGGRRGGRPLPEPDRGYLEGRFGANFGPVRLHDDSGAHAAAAAIGPEPSPRATTSSSAPGSTLREPRGAVTSWPTNSPT